MFNPARWAEALVNSLEKEGIAPEEGLDTLKVFAGWLCALPAPASGTRDAGQAETILVKALEQVPGRFAAGEITARFFILLIRKNRARHIDAVIGRVQKMLNQKRGAVSVVLEYAVPPDDEFRAAVKNGIMKRMGAREVLLTEKSNPDLIGGYKLKIDDEVMDASVRFRLRKLESFLASGQSIYGDGGN